MPDSPVPYCGPAPDPGELAWRWNMDPWAIAALAVGLAAYVMFAPRRGAQANCFYAGLAIVALTLLSPLCALSSALFSARVIHHGLLSLAAAPLLAWAVTIHRPIPGGLLSALLAHTLVFWAWHSPPIYAWALASDTAYWLMQVSLVASATLFWLAVRQASGLAAAGALLAGMVQMGLLGALITLAPLPLFSPHALTTSPWGLTPLEDQQLAGLIMWAPMSLAYLFAALWHIRHLLEPTPRSEAEA